jgi:membrane dipeptidase
MSALEFTDHRGDPAAWATELGISRDAVDVYLGSEIIDLHIDSFIWTRIFGYDLTKRHGQGAFGAAFYSQVDLPRMREAQIAGGVWVITTNPLRSSGGRARAFARNLPRLRAILSGCESDVAVVRTVAEYRAARARGLHAAFLGIQGGNALDADGALAQLDDAILRVTLVHLSNSSLGSTSAPTGGKTGLSQKGREYVAALESKRIFVDLAHVNRAGFFDAVAAHDKTLPLMCSHTGVTGVNKHWRNLDDEQLRAIADSGGVVGVMYQSTFLGDPLLGGRAESIVRHLEHIATVAGEDVPALGSDWDGAIVPPRDMRTCLELPRLVQIMLDRKWSESRIKKALGTNFLAAVERMRG